MAEVYLVPTELSDYLYKYERIKCIALHCFLMCCPRVLLYPSFGILVSYLLSN